MAAPLTATIGTIGAQTMNVLAVASNYATQVAGIGYERATSSADLYTRQAAERPVFANRFNATASQATVAALQGVQLVGSALTGALTEVGKSFASWGRLD